MKIREISVGLKVMFDSPQGWRKGTVSQIKGSRVTVVLPEGGLWVLKSREVFLAL